MLKTDVRVFPLSILAVLLIIVAWCASRPALAQTAAPDGGTTSTGAANPADTTPPSAPQNPPLPGRTPAPSQTPAAPGPMTVTPIPRLSPVAHAAPTPRPRPTPVPRPTAVPHPTPVPRPTAARPAPPPVVRVTSKPPPPTPRATAKPPIKTAPAASGAAPEDMPLSDVAPVIPGGGAAGAPAPATGTAGATTLAGARPAAATTPGAAATPAVPGTAPPGAAGSAAPAGTPLPNAAANSGQPEPGPGHAAHGQNPATASTAASAATGDTESAGDQLNPSSSRGLWNVWGTFQIDFMRQALWAGLLVALMCSYLGLYVVLKRIVFVGVALAEVSSAGIALAILLNFAPLLGALGFMVIGVILFSIHWSPRRVPHESYIGILYSVAAALGILLISKSASGEQHMLTLLQGDILTISAKETWQMLGAFVVVLLIHTLFNKEFVMVSFDRESANTLGYRAAHWDLLLFLTIGLTIAFAIRSVGVLLTSTMLILPASTALLVTSRLRHAWLLVPLLGALPVIIGLHLSLIADLPASAVIVAASFVLFLPALGYFFLRQR